ncbi:MAG: SAM-dependent methyltransferase [Gammaproteobacteria bacterium CG11_big_fil_rev_8_21_14_0_20_46_22]|nr:MAG: SAM-dependent methyltransferase [Gammaproteobacteria bacterium CG12_big_fil_rev_8_21_14_0_65_46_12]PIR12114.1 MAG: SAM-dependent methyltransferase [Gammaproteobacteria bacterium CG11_big_fil_rev_8_21_14_0_20_46_22]
MLSEFLLKNPSFEGNFACLSHASDFENQAQVNKVFSDKWQVCEKTMTEDDSFYRFQKNWYLKLYGFSSEAELAEFLSDKKVIFDAGCGLGYKAAWFAQMAPHAVVVGMDYSAAAKQAAEQYKGVKNLFFVQGDISKPFFRKGVVDFVSCDQVIMHTENPENTFFQLAQALKLGGEFACYVYAKKALPRELLDEYWRSRCKSLTHKDLLDLSEQLTELGRTLSDLKLTIDFPDIPLLGIKGGRQDLQRFLYWNFIKCFWNADLGREVSMVTNYDWYSPSNAKRYSKEEFETLVRSNGLKIVYFHSEESCYSGRFKV